MSHVGRKMRGLQLTWYVFSGAWKLWPCVNQRAHFPLELPALLPFNFFARFFGMAVGEASHPGPPSDPDRRLTKLVVSNPTAVGADVVVLSETSATSVVQIETTGKLFKKGFRCFWSKPVPLKIRNVLWMIDLLTGVRPLVFVSRCLLVGLGSPSRPTCGTVVVCVVLLSGFMPMKFCWSPFMVLPRGTNMALV